MIQNLKNELINEEADTLRVAAITLFETLKQTHVVTADRMLHAAKLISDELDKYNNTGGEPRRAAVENIRKHGADVLNVVYKLRNNILEPETGKATLIRNLKMV